MPSDATPAPTPPVIGFTGKPLKPKEGESEFKEQVPDGSGYFLWRKENMNGRELWVPQDFIENPKGLTV